MGNKTRRRFDAQLKAKVALAALRDEATIAELAAPDPEALAAMRWLDEQYLAMPFYGSRRMTTELRKARPLVGQVFVERLWRS